MLRGEATAKDHLESYEVDECKKKVEEFLEATDPAATIILSITH